MPKHKTPLELVAYFKNKETRKEDGSEMSDAEKRKMALSKAQEYKNQKVKKTTKISQHAVSGC
jgi:hypothetical protein